MPTIPDGSIPRFHHVGIQTTDLENSLAWYRDFFECTPTWTLDRFSELTHRRLPGIERLTELALGDTRIHLFQRPGLPALDPSASIAQFQHVCLMVDSPERLVELRNRWIALFESKNYFFAFPDQPTAIVEDDDGVQSFYAYDVNGLEFEFTYIPEASGR